jgi:hypothetical protein
MRTLVALLMILATALVLLAPIASAQIFTNVYYFNAVQGYYYAINTGGQSYRVFYIDSTGQTVYVTAYRWDANSSYIIFQSPISGRVYLRQESYTLSTLDTKSWFTFSQSDFAVPGSPTTTGTVTLEFYAGTSVFFIANTTWSTLSLSRTFKTYTVDSVVYSPPRLVVYATSQWDVVQRKRMSYQWSNWVDTGANNYPNVRIRFYSLVTAIESYSYWTTWGSYTYDKYLSYKYYTSTTYYARATYYAPSIADSANGIIIMSNYNAYSTNAPPSSMTNNITFVVSATFTATSQSSKIFTKNADGIIVASNGNVIKVFDSLSGLSYASLYTVASTYSYYLYTQQISVSFPSTRDVSKPLVIPLNTSSIAASVKSPNPAVFINDISAWTPAYLINYGAQEAYLVVPVPQIANRNSLTLYLVYNYPIQYTAPSIQYRYTTDILTAFAVSGAVAINTGRTTISGNITLSNYLGSTIVLTLYGTDNSYTIEKAVYSMLGNRVVIYVNDTNAVIRANPINIVSALIIYNTATEQGYSYTASNVGLQQWTMDRISYVVAGSIIGSWSYRIPIYITLSELPSLLTETGFVFRVELPVGDWIKAGLLSPALEDLMIVDSASKPCLFYIYRVDKGTAVVYVRYDAAITSNTVVLYILLKNTNLWNTGSTFSTLSTFDGVNPKEFVDDFGYNVYYSYLTYNAILITTSQDTAVKLGKMWYDFMAINSSMVWEQHGSTTYFNKSITTFGDNNELLIYVSRSDWNDILVYVDNRPAYSIRLSDFRAEPAYYIGYKNAKFVARFKMLMYSYSLGQLTGGFVRPTTAINYPQPQQIQVSSDPWGAVWSMAPFLFILIILAIVMRLMGGVGGGGAGGGGVRLP